jgi:hypothetical protein
MKPALCLFFGFEAKGEGTFEMQPSAMIVPSPKTATTHFQVVLPKDWVAFCLASTVIQLVFPFSEFFQPLLCYFSLRERFPIGQTEIAKPLVGVYYAINLPFYTQCAPKAIEHHGDVALVIEGFPDLQAPLEVGNGGVKIALVPFGPLRGC